jgi:hypothetical protein
LPTGVTAGTTCRSRAPAGVGVAYQAQAGFVCCVVGRPCLAHAAALAAGVQWGGGGMRLHYRHSTGSMHARKTGQLA